MANELEEYYLLVFSGELTISEKTFSVRINDPIALKERIKNKISELSDLNEWYEEKLSEEEKTQGIYWKLAHKNNTENIATIVGIPSKFKNFIQV